MTGRFVRLPHRLVRCLWKTVIIQIIKVILEFCPAKEDVQRVVAFAFFLILAFLLIGIFLGSQESNMTKLDLSPGRRNFLIEQYKQELAAREIEQDIHGEQPLFVNSKYDKENNKALVLDEDTWNGVEGQSKKHTKQELNEKDRDEFLDKLEDYQYEKDSFDDPDPDDPNVNKEVLADVIKQKLQKRKESLNRNRLDYKSRTANKSSNLRNFQKIHPKSIELPRLHKYCLIYDLNSTVEETYDCIFLNFSIPKVPVCLYPDSQDIHVSAHLRSEGIWENHLLNQFRDFLLNDDSLGFVDIGANLGIYSLIAARMGHRVVAVEPYLENIKHFHKAIQMGNLQDRITIVENAVSDRRETIPLIIREDNQGGVALSDNQTSHGVRLCQKKNCPTAETIYMDDLLEVIHFDNAIIKIDIEGHEHRAFSHAFKLLDLVHVPYIFMEWMKLRSYYGTELTSSTDKTLTAWLVQALHDNGYEAYSSVNGRKLEPDFWFAWGDDIIWKLKTSNQE